MFLEDPDDKSSRFRQPGEHGPKPAEVYGFVGSITTIVATGIPCLWHLKKFAQLRICFSPSNLP